MSFTSTIKSELCRQEIPKGCCRRSELLGLIVTNGNLQFSGRRQVNLNVVTEHAYIARRLYKLLKGEFAVSPEVLARKKVRLRKNISYLIRVSDSRQAREILQQLGIIDAENRRVAAGAALPPCCRRAYLRGCFLAGGSISNPETNGYHWEIATELVAHAENLRRLLAEMGVKSGIVPRKQHQVVYVKDSEQIAQLLSLMGSIQGRLDFENARVLKEMRNRVNRLVNCETANVNKTVEAAQRQVSAIRRLAALRGLESLSPGLRQVARLRLENPEATLDELGQLANPPLSKSAVNYRLRRLLAMADMGQGPDKPNSL